MDSEVLPPHLGFSAPDPEPLLAQRICRICHDSGDSAEAGLLISPCLCDGSMRWVHHHCLDHWRVQRVDFSGRESACELCGFRYRFELQHSSCSGVCVTVLRHVGPVFLLLILLVIAIWEVTHTASLTALYLGSLLGIKALVDIIRFVLLWRRFRAQQVPSEEVVLSPQVAAALVVFAKWNATPSGDHARGMQRAAAEEAAARWEGQAAAIHIAEATAAGIEDPDADTDPGGNLGSFALCACGCLITMFLSLVALYLLAFLLLHMSATTTRLVLLGLAVLGYIYGTAVVFLAIRYSFMNVKRGRAGLLALPRTITQQERLDLKT